MTRLNHVLRRLFRRETLVAVLCTITLLLLWLPALAYGVRPTAPNLTDVSTYETAMISSGDNRPDFNARDPELKALLVSLHLGIRPKTFEKQSGWSHEKYHDQLQLLIDKGFVRQDKGRFRPSCMIITDQEGQQLYKLAEPLAQQIATAIISDLGAIRSYYSQTELSKTKPFEQLAFLILSDVLLDNWQISNVEKEFLGKDRPVRHGKNYYFALLQNLRPPREAFGIYGNGVLDQFMVYGNNRKGGASSIATPNLSEMVVVCEADQALFQTLAQFFKPRLLDLLQKNKPYIERIYRKTGYSSEISFEEFFIWWYHFLYTRATNILAEKGHLDLPKSGNFYYRLVSETPPQRTTATSPGIKLPSTDEVLERYVQAMGGRSALEKLVTEVRTGELRNHGKVFPLAIHAAASGRWNCTIQSDPPVRMLCTRTNSWQPGNRPEEISPAVLVERAATFEIQFPLHVKSYCPELQVVSKVQWDGRPVLILEGRLENASLIQMGFDEQSGLLLKCGSTEFHDYQSQEGIQRPSMLAWPQDGNS
ncbi:MAG TPA: hypothetical protein VEC99_18725, partial [Clostridia bacterium]|nr:hypothetical protein [Clostridia bacterium]